MNERNLIRIAAVICLLLYADKFTSGNYAFPEQPVFTDSLTITNDTLKETSKKTETELDNLGFLNFKSYQYPDGSEISSTIGINIRYQLEDVNKQPFADISSKPYLWKGEVGNAIVFIGQYGVFAVQINKNIEPSKPCVILDDKVENYEIKSYPNKDNWAIIVINGKPKLVIYTVKRGVIEVPEIRDYNPKKDG
jgi:hypothetical protein